MNRRILGIIVVLGLAAAVARADMILWNNGVNGNWSIAANWDVNDVPDAGDDAVISAAGTYTVDLDAGVSVDSLDISNADTTFELNANTLTLLTASGLSNAGTLVNNNAGAIDGVFSNAAAVNVNAGTTLTLFGPTVTNDGMIVVNPTGGNAQTILNIDGDVVVEGTGALVLNQTSLRARLNTESESTITNAAGHTISGTGQILGVLHNQGSVVSDRTGLPLELVTNNKTNTGTMTATNDSFLDITGVTIDQTASGLGDDAGQIIADGGTVRLENGAMIESGTLSTPNGVILNAASDNTLSNVTNMGTVNINAATSVTAGGASLVNDGTIVVNVNFGNSQTSMSFDPNVVLDGSGDIQLNHTNNLAMLLDGPFTQMSSHAIHGRGEIHAGMNNHGTITADVNNLALELLTADKTNNGLMTTANGGRLQIGGITVSQFADTEGVNGQIVADDGLIQLVGGATISGGTVSSANGGVVQTTAGTNALNDVNSSASVEVNAGTTLNATGGSFVNNGTIVVNPTFGNVATTLGMGADIALSGTGEIVLNHTTIRAQLTGGPMTHAAGHTIHGTGQILAPMENHGDITADRLNAPMVLANTETLNLGTLSATSNGTMTITGVVITQSEGLVADGIQGQIIADGGIVELDDNATIIDGSLNTPNASQIAVNTTSAVLTDVTNNGLVNVNAGSTLTADGSALANNGTIVVNPTFGNVQTSVNVGADTALAGNGDLLLNHTTVRAQIIGGPTTNGADHTIHGVGQILAPMDNLGAITADRNAGTLALLNGDMLNLGTLTATNNGTLSIGSVTITQSEGTEGVEGQIIADGGTVSLASGATIVDGSLNTPNSSEITVNATNILLTDVTNNGLVNVVAGQTLSADGTALTNNGTIVVNSSVGNAMTELSMGVGTALAGTGDVLLNHTSSRAQIIGGPTTNGENHTIHGTGEIVADLVNEGVVNADRSGADLDVIGGAKTNNATMMASNDGRLDVATNVDGTGGWTADGGTVRFNAGVQATTTGPIVIINGGAVVLNDADVTGSDLMMDDSSVLTVGSSISLSGVVSYAMTDEGLWSWAGDAVLTLTGGDAAGCMNEWTLYEVGGDAAAGGAGFALATLEVADGAAVSLVDTLDNGNRGGGGEAEALAVSTLTLGAGAKLNLNGHRLFIDGVEATTGPHGGGLIVDTVGDMGDLNGDGVFDIADRFCFTNCFSGPDVLLPPGCAGADLDGDGDADCDDWAMLRQLTGGGARPILRACSVDAGPPLLPISKSEPAATTAAPACGAGVGSAGFVSLSLLAVGFAGTNRRRR